MDKTITVRQKWLVNELVLSFWALKKSAKAQSNLMILSKVMAVTDDDNDNDNNNNNNDNRQIDTVVKTVFSQPGGLKTWRFDENWGGQILHKSNTFYDENVIITRTLSSYFLLMIILILKFTFTKKPFPELGAERTLNLCYFANLLQPWTYCHKTKGVVSFKINQLP